MAIFQLGAEVQSDKSNMQMVALDPSHGNISVYDGGSGPAPWNVNGVCESLANFDGRRAWCAGAQRGEMKEAETDGRARHDWRLVQI